MPKYIGFDKAVSKNRLFTELFRSEFRENSLRDWVRWEFIKKGMHYLRQRTHCFVVSACINGQWYYYVPETENDLKYYIKNLDNTVKKIRWMQERAFKSVQEKWYKDKWTLK